MPFCVTALAVDRADVRWTAPASRPAVQSAGAEGAVWETMRIVTSVAPQASGAAPD